MKSRFIRESLLLSLPIAALGGVFWLKSHNGGLALSKFESPFYTGPVRVECTPLAPVDATPWQVSRGYTFNAAFEVKMEGRQVVPNTWTGSDLQSVSMPHAGVFWRKGKVWSRARGVLSTASPSSNRVEVAADLSSIPRDAEEVRLRGHMIGQKIYEGPTPKGWVPPPNLRNSVGAPGAVSHAFFYASNPFDLVIKAPGKPLPNPVVDRRPRIEVLDAKLRDLNPLSARILVELKVRHLDKLEQDDRKWGVLLTDPTLFDAEGKEVIILDKSGKVITLSYPGLGYPGYSPEDGGGVGQRAVGFETWDRAPRGGWNSMKLPMTLKATLTDGKCWPTSVRVKLQLDPPVRG